MNTKPVVFLAFANDRVEEASYLRQLPQELNGIRQALKPAVQAGLCEVVERANATIEQILDVFQDEYFRGRIAIFHYGGHANSYQLLLETATGQHSQAHTEGLVGFLSQQRGLQLVFLNGCSSQQQAEGLIEAGLPAVIGTSQSINDEVAVNIAIRFYKGLAQGGVIDTAWQEAIEEVKIHKGTANMRDLFWEGADTTAVSQFPWQLLIRGGAEQVKTWSLPEASGNPLYGLPSPSYNDLPEQPFRFLERYHRKDAALFFGRGHYIKDLFDRCTDPHSSPIILLYGQSGVGKSSMLEAGLFPRLEQVCEVIYVRRNAEKGLLGTMKEALGVGEGASVHTTDSAVADIQAQMKQLEALTHTATGDLKVKLHDALQIMQEKVKSAKQILPVQESSIREAWQRREQASGKPLVVLLDQVEEMYTKPAKHINQEREEALAEVYDIFADPSRRPQGKLILSYRKEYHPEIEEAFKVLRLPREHVFLRKLDKQGIEEVVAGLGSTEALQRKYRLNIENHLPEVIADDLLEDEDSPVAPILQILLTKMWLITEGQEHRSFSIATYQHLKKEGILMGDFFKEQMGKIRAWNEGVERSGLALDVLYFHTTNLGTAGVRSWDLLQQRYVHKQEVLEELIQKFKELYLLTDTATGSGLAHDTLAPLVQQEFRKSDLPGHRAYRILDNKKQEFALNNKSLLSGTDLQLVETGKEGMPTWDKIEEKLIEESKAWKAKQDAFKKLVRKLAVAGAVLITSLAIFATYAWVEALNQKEEAIQQQKLAEDRLVFNKLRRLKLEMDLETKMKYPKIYSMLQDAYEEYPNNPMTRNLIYQFTMKCGADNIVNANDYREAISKSNRELASSVDPTEQPMSPDLYSANPRWKINIKNFSNIVLHNNETGEEAGFYVPIPDYGVFHSLSVHPNYDLLVGVGSDGLLRLYDTTGEQIWKGGNEGEYQAAVFEEATGNLILINNNGQAYYRNLDLPHLMQKAKKCWPDRS